MEKLVYFYLFSTLLNFYYYITYIFVYLRGVQEWEDYKLVWNTQELFLIFLSGMGGLQAGVEPRGVRGHPDHSRAFRAHLAAGRRALQ